MKRRWLIRFGLVAVLGLAGSACYLWLTCGNGGINRMTVLRIKPGMSHEDVDVVIGLPYGDHSSIPPDVGGRINRVHYVGLSETCYWHGDTGKITVLFDADGKVKERHFSSSTKSLFDSVYRWIGTDPK